jgi:hypothetical protein
VQAGLVGYAFEMGHKGCFRFVYIELYRISESRNSRLVCMRRDEMPSWSFLTNHAKVLLCIAHDPGIRLREIGETVGITERAAHRIVSELVAAGYISRKRNGRRNHYAIQAHLPLPDPLAREQKVGDFLAILRSERPARTPKKPFGLAAKS